MIMPDTIGPGNLPFAVGRVDPSREFVHILDDTSLDILLRTLDTVADFVAYLQKKEAFIREAATLTLRLRREPPRCVAVSDTRISPIDATTFCHR